jgi:succinate-semialdehyde dehydrogenase/glutarate-semialdehyde dehydrogenase
MESTLYIDGVWCQSATGKTFPVHNPATGELVGSVADGTREDTARAVAAAAKAFPEWAARPARQRGALLDNANHLMVERREHLARTLTLEEGKPLAEARGEIDYAADFLLWYGQEAARNYGHVVPYNVPGKRQMALRQPIGVVGCITPWNFPAAMVTRKVAPALAAGCTVVFKPAEQTPLTSYEIFKIFADAGFPAGTVNHITSNDGPAVGREFLDNPVVRKISFTGSTEVGKYLMREGAAQIKKLALELGGHAPMLVFDDADLDKAAAGAVYAKFRNTGQTCISMNRLLVSERVLEPFLEKFSAKVKALRVGNGLEDNVEVGPLIDAPTREKVLSHIQDATGRGARVICGGKRATGGALDRGNWVEPTILTGVTPEMRIFSEETFGPVAPVIVFKTEEEAIQLANRSVYGLACYAYTRDVGRVMRVSEALEYGMVGVNDPAPTGAHAPFGGIKESGLGTEGGHFGMEEFTYVKFVSIGI